MRLILRLLVLLAGITSSPGDSTPVGNMREDVPFPTNGPLRGVCKVLPYSKEGEREHSLDASRESDSSGGD